MNNTMETTEFGFDEYIMPTTYSTMAKLESYDAQLYPSGTNEKKKIKLYFPAVIDVILNSLWLL